MKTLLTILIVLNICTAQTAMAKKVHLGKYQQLSIKLDELCKTKAKDEDLIKSIRKAGGFHARQRKDFFIKGRSLNFPQDVRLRILKDGNWDLITEDRSAGMDIKEEHFAPASEHQLFVFSNGKEISPSALKRTDRPTLVVMTPEKVIVIATEHGKFFCLLDRPDQEFANLKYKQ